MRKDMSPPAGLRVYQNEIGIGEDLAAVPSPITLRMAPYTAVPVLLPTAA